MMVGFAAEAGKIVLPQRRKQDGETVDSFFVATFTQAPDSVGGEEGREGVFYGAEVRLWCQFRVS